MPDVTKWEEQMEKLCNQQTFLLTFNSANIRFESGYEREFYFAFTDKDYEKAIQVMEDLDLDGVIAVYEQPVGFISLPEGYDLAAYDAEKNLLWDEKDLAGYCSAGEKPAECSYLMIAKSGQLPKEAFQIL